MGRDRSSRNGKFPPWTWNYLFKPAKMLIHSMYFNLNISIIPSLNCTHNFCIFFAFDYTGCFDKEKAHLRILISMLRMVILYHIGCIILSSGKFHVSYCSFHFSFSNLVVHVRQPLVTRNRNKMATDTLREKRAFVSHELKDVRSSKRLWKFGVISRWTNELPWQIVASDDSKADEEHSDAPSPSCRRSATNSCSTPLSMY